MEEFPHANQREDLLDNFVLVLASKVTHTCGTYLRVVHRHRNQYGRYGQSGFGPTTF